MAAYNLYCSKPQILVVRLKCAQKEENFIFIDGIKYRRCLEQIFLSRDLICNMGKG
jgi:hypothetical protein